MIENISQLKEFLALCREFAITEITHKDFHIKFGPMPIADPVAAPETKSEIDKFIDGQITQEDLIFYSAGASQEGNE